MSPKGRVGAGVGVGMLRGRGIPLVANKKVSWFLSCSICVFLFCCSDVRFDFVCWFLVFFDHLFFCCLVSRFLGFLVS